MIRPLGTLLPTHHPPGADAAMPSRPFPDPDQQFMASDGVVYGVNWVADGRVSLVEVPLSVDDMGTVALDLDAEEWAAFADLHQLVECEARHPMELGEQGPTG